MPISASHCTTRCAARRAPAHTVCSRRAALRVPILQLRQHHGWACLSRVCTRLPSLIGGRGRAYSPDCSSLLPHASGEHKETCRSVSFLGQGRWMSVVTTKLLLTAFVGHKATAAWSRKPLPGRRLHCTGRVRGQLQADSLPGKPPPHQRAPQPPRPGERALLRGWPPLDQSTGARRSLHCQTSLLHLEGPHPPFCCTCK